VRRAAFVLLAGSLALSWTVVGAPSALGAPTLTVDTFDDTFDGSCADGDCSLREAVEAVDAGGTVRLPPGFYLLSRSGPGPHAGDVDLARPMTIVGVGETGSFLEASSLGDRVFDVRADVHLRRLTLLGGSPVDTGGILRARSGTTRVTSTTLFGGRAADGGAVSVGDGGAVTIDRSWITASRATGRGGGLRVRGTTTLLRSTVSENRASGGGGLFVGSTADLSVVESTVSRNAADRGGGIRAVGDVQLFSSTLVANRAEVGGGVLVWISSTTTAAHSMFARNEASVRGALCVRRLVSEGFNVSETRGCGLTGSTDLAGTDPLIGALKQNGGPTPTHAVKVGSPAIDRGGDCAGRDQRGAPREDCDSGAYELVLCLGRAVTMVGTPGRDELSGGLGRDVFLGLGGDDEFQGSLDRDRGCGGPGDDVLIGGPDRDRLAGNAGRDILLGEAGDDLLFGGLGTDVCRGGDGHDVSRRCETVVS
jgi:CSLREA domain-containing protein